MTWSLATAPSWAAAAPAERVVVYDLRASPELVAIARQATERILQHLAADPKLRVIGESEVSVLALNESDRHEVMAPCDAARESCLAKLKEIVEAEKVITGRLGRWDESYLLTLSLADVKKAAVERGESCTFEQPNQLAPCVDGAVDRLLGLSKEGASRFVLEDQAAGMKLALFSLADYGVGADLAENLTQILALELNKLKGVSVISREEVAAMLDYEANKQILTCKSNVACLIEIGGAIGARFLVAGGAGRLGDAYVVHLKLMDVERAEVVHRVSETFRGPPRQLAQAVRFAAHRLLGRETERDGTLELMLDGRRARVAIDERREAPLGEHGTVPSLRPGKHALLLEVPGYERLYQDVYVEEQAVTKLRPELTPLPSPWYEEWWPWAIAVAVAGGAATTAALISRHSPEGGVVHARLREGP